MKIAIIGTAGRGQDYFRLQNDSFDKMVDAATRVINSQLGGFSPSFELISGGAAFADHVVVRLFLSGLVTKLRLALPCPFLSNRMQYLDTGAFDFRTNPGGAANALHRKFSDLCGFRSLPEIGKAIEKGAEVFVGKGFHDRNSVVAEADAVIAFTFGTGSRLKDGGTSNTMEKYLQNKAKERQPPVAFHVDLTSWKLYRVPQAPASISSA